MPSNVPGSKEPSEDGSKLVEEVSTSDQNESGVTLGSAEEIQNLVGGTDIKVCCYSNL